MIQLSNLLSATPEIPAKTGGAGLLDSRFADVFAGELEGDGVASGKILPVALPAGGKTLPVDLPVDLPGGAGTLLPDLTAAAPDDAALAPAVDDGEIEAAVVGNISIPNAQPVIATLQTQPQALEISPGDETETKNDAANTDTLPALTGKLPEFDLNARLRADGPVPTAKLNAAAEAETSDADETQSEAPAPAAPKTDNLPETAASALLAMKAEVSPLPAAIVPDETVSGQDRPAATRPDAPASEPRRGDERLPTAPQIAASDQPAKTRDAPVSKDGAMQGGERENARQGEGARPQRAAPEFRFELTKDAGDARLDRTAASPIGQIRMPSASASQIVVPEQAAIHGSVGDGGSLPSAANPASTSYGAAQGIRPHDFATLVDRLVEARETARGGSINVAVMHADFGEVSLRFKQDAGGLSVSMSNNDPEFARAVSAAQADGPQTGDNGSHSGRRDDGYQNGGAFSRAGRGDGQGQSSADANLNGGERRQHMKDDNGSAQPASQPRLAEGSELSRRNGIFA